MLHVVNSLAPDFVGVERLLKYDSEVYEVKSTKIGDCLEILLLFYLLHTRRPNEFLKHPVLVPSAGTSIYARQIPMMALMPTTAKTQLIVEHIVERVP